MPRYSCWKNILMWLVYSLKSVHGVIKALLNMQGRLVVSSTSMVILFAVDGFSLPLNAIVDSTIRKPKLSGRRELPFLSGQTYIGIWEGLMLLFLPIRRRLICAGG